MGRTSFLSQYSLKDEGYTLKGDECIGLKEKMDLLHLKDNEEKQIIIERKNSVRDLNTKPLTFEGISIKIQNIDDDLSSERLAEEFRRFGEVISSKIILPSDKKKRRYAVLNYRSPAEAAKAISYFNEKVIISNILSVTFMSHKTQVKRRRPSTPTMQMMGHVAFVQQSRFQPGAYYSPRTTRSQRSISASLPIPKSKSLYSFPTNGHRPLTKTISS